MYYTHARAQCLALPIDDTGADPEIGHGGGGWTLIDFFSHKNHKIVHTQSTKNETNFTQPAQN